MTKAHANYEIQLNEMYDNFYKCNCNYKNCSKCMCETPANIKFDYAAKVGENYGNYGMYKVLVVGKESKNQHIMVEKPIDNISKAPNTHYRGTLYTLALLQTDQVPKDFSVNDLKIYNNLLKQFCLTNYFKCAFRKYEENGKRIKVSGLPINENMRNTCYKLLLREIEILTPDIIIVQGDFTSKPFWDALKSKYELQKLYPKSKKKKCKIFLEKYTSNNHAFYVLWSYHPCSPHWHRYLDKFIEAINVFKEDSQIRM